VLVFWWQGRGYQTILIWLVTMCVFGVIIAASRQIIPDEPWYWGLAFVAAAIVNWRRGSELNARSRQRHTPTNLKSRLL
jgi:hypothetical protein